AAEAARGQAQGGLRHDRTRVRGSGNRISSAQEMRERTAVAILVAIWLRSALLWLQPGITRPDRVGYYVYFPSAYLGHDLLFFDEWQRFGLVPGGRILHKEITPT